MTSTDEIIGAANHGAGTLIAHRWKRYEMGRGTGCHMKGYNSVCGRANTSSVLDIGPEAKKCKACFKRPNG